MGRATTFLTRTALAAGSAALVISAGVGASSAAPAAHPADTPLTCNSGQQLVGTVCTVLTGAADALLPNGGPNVVVTVPASAVPDVPTTLPAPLNTSLVTVNVPVQLCDVTVGAVDGTADGSCPATPASGPSVSTGGAGPLVGIAAPVQVCGDSVGAVNGAATAPCPATGPSTVGDGSTGGLVGLAAPVQVCGVTVGAVDASAVGACPTSGPTAVTGTGGGLSAVGAGIQACGSSIGAGHATSIGDCPARGQAVGGGDGALTLNVPVQVCGETAGASGGAANGSCPEAAVPATDPAPATTPATVPPGSATSNVANDITATTTGNDASQLAPVANVANPDDSSASGAGSGSSGSGDGNGSLPVTGISIVAILLGAGALMQSGIIAKMIAARKVRHTAV
ncbi:MAG: hypothetical protein JWL72_345 [Ilumatobacteraceae bacterium]|nr:hypothetical protein [Ilumatobacteraceae bacterium]